jgi:hypothetical protein
VPPTAPVSVSVVAASVENVPAPSSVTVRSEVKLAVVPSVPPAKLSPPEAAPRLPSDDTCSVPPAIAVPPE